MQLRIPKRLSVSLLAVLLGATQLSAGITGKITGRVIDADNGETLAGVNIIIEGTSLGAASDLDGRYTILNVPPGTYTLKATMIGYAPVVARNVRVEMEQTTTLDFSMKAEIIAGEEVVVVAQRPIVTPDVSASVMHVGAETITNLPVKEVSQVLVLQAGIEKTSEGVKIRGGGPRQSSFLVDGLSMNDERANIPFLALSLNSIKEIKIQTGGFNAEYGNVRSGIINVVTREGDRKFYSGGITFQYRPAGPKHYGPAIYGPDSYFTRPYLDPAVAFTGTASGGWDAYTQRQYPSFEGWKAVAEATLQDDDPTNDLTPEGAQQLWKWQHRRNGNITKADYVLDLGFGGPVPFLRGKLGSPRFFLSHFEERDMFIFPLSRDSYRDNVTQLKISADLTPTTKLIVTGLYGQVHSVSPYNWRPTPTGRVLRTAAEVADLVNSSSGNAILYTPAYFSPSSIYRTMIGMKFTHMLSPKSFYEISLQHNINKYDTFKLADRDTTKRFEPVPGYRVDEAPMGYWGYGVSGIDGMILGGWMNLGRDSSRIATTKLRFDFTSQINDGNQARAGIEVVYNDYDIKSLTDSPSMNTWRRRQVYRRYPYRAAVYVQDKMEFEGFIANLGLRLDYSNSNGIRYNLTPYDQFFSEGFGQFIEAQAPTEKAKGILYLSPHLGVAHPITVNSKLYFNYGHYTQEPESSFRYRIQREANGLVTSIGNPNLQYEKTIAYELGYAQNLFDMFLLNLAAYYKDVTNQPGWVYYENLNASVQYNIPENNNYEDIRGFEATLTKRAGRWLTGFVNYTYEVRTYGYFGLRRYYEDPNKQRDYLRLNPYQERPHPQPYARANIDVRTPPDFGPRWLGHHILGDWDLNVLADWKAGAFSTFNPRNLPGVVDNVQWRDFFNIDLRLSKLVTLGRYRFMFYLDITNVLNTKYLNFAGFSDSFDYNDYLESLHFSWEEGPEHGNDRVGDYRKEGVPYEPYDPTDPTKTEADLKRILETKAYIDMPNLTSFTFLNPRDFKFGIRVSF